MDQVMDGSRPVSRLCSNSWQGSVSKNRCEYLQTTPHPIPGVLLGSCVPRWLLSYFDSGASLCLLHLSFSLCEVNV